MEKIGEEWKSLEEDFDKLEKIHDEYIQKSRQVHKTLGNERKAIKHHMYLVKHFKQVLKKSEQSEEISEKFKKQHIKLVDIQGELPAENNGFYLNLILGSNLNVSLLTKAEKYKYKQEYEEFKWNMTIVTCLLALTAWFWSFRELDSILCFFKVWYYCTLTIRESVLRVNGSKIKGWWLAHHYLSIAVPGILLTWKEGACYQQFRPAFLFFVFYISLVQLAQTQYQSGCLRRLHALGQGHHLDITVEGFTSFQFKGLTFLLPFLGIGYVIQLYLAWILYGFGELEVCDGLWQVWSLSFLFATIAIGNIITTSMVLLLKLRRSPPSMASLSRKYSSAPSNKEEKRVTEKLH